MYVSDAIVSSLLLAKNPMHSLCSHYLQLANAKNSSEHTVSKVGQDVMHMHTGKLCVGSSMKFFLILTQKYYKSPICAEQLWMHVKDKARFTELCVTL
jgi:hypothetical protein